MNDPAQSPLPSTGGLLLPGGWRRWLAAGGLVLLFGLARLPLETRLTRERRAAHLGEAALNRSLREQVGQLGFLAALSGFRTLVADVLWIEAHTAWERVEYGKMNLLFGTVTTLAPHNVEFWEGSAWHMAFNASRYVMDDPRQPNVARRLKAQREYFLLGRDYAKRGVANNPEAYTLYQRLALIWSEKFQDHCQAAAAYRRAAACPHPPTYEKRFAAYQLALCPGHEREAWQALRALYDQGPQERLPTLEKDLREMEDRLDLPDGERIYPRAARAPR